MTDPGWYPDPDKPGSQRYWDGEAWTEHRAEGMKPVAHWKILLVAAIIVPGLIALWTEGTFDEPLSAVGLNHDPCVEIYLTGNKICGDELEQFCEQRFARQVNREACRAVE